MWRARLSGIAVVVGLALGVLGCAPAGTVPGAATQPVWVVNGGGPEGSAEAMADGSAADPRPAAAFGVRLEIWAIAVPRGVVSANEPFWRRVDENALDPVRHDVLFKNGFRVGVAATEDWSYLQGLIERHPARHQLHALTVFEERAIEVPVRRGVEFQTLSFFDAENRLSLRSFDQADNLLQLTFGPAAGRSDAARIVVTPVVRSNRERLEFNERHEARTIRYVFPERYFDLALATEVPFDRMLVVSPSTDTAHSTVIGRNFLMLEGVAELSEIVLLMVPRRIEVQPVAAQPRAGPGGAGQPGP